MVKEYTKKYMWKVYYGEECNIALFDTRDAAELFANAMKSNGVLAIVNNWHWEVNVEN